MSSSPGKEKQASNQSCDSDRVVSLRSWKTKVLFQELLPSVVTISEAVGYQMFIF